MQRYTLVKNNSNEILFEKTNNKFGFTMVVTDDKIEFKKYRDINRISDIVNYNFTMSTVNKCLINNTKIDKLKYKHILSNIYELINDGSKIIKTSKLNISTKKRKQRFLLP